MQQHGQPLARAVPHSAGLLRPLRQLPADACDSHMHVFDPRFAPSAHWPRRPPDAPVAAYRQLQERIGTQRTVLVTPSTYGTDNACMLDALATLGASARGVAVVNADAPVEQLKVMAAQGVCGLRVNFVTAQSWGPTTAAMLERLAGKAALLGWHIQILASPEQLVELNPVLKRLPTPLVIDHMARIGPDGLGSHAFATIARLIESGNTWIKLSGAYMGSRQGGPGYADMAALGQALVKLAPERLVWGSDWPHTTEAPGSVDDAALVDLLDTWCSGDAAVMDRILVANPERLYGFAPTPTPKT